MATHIRTDAVDQIRDEGGPTGNTAPPPAFERHADDDYFGLDAEELIDIYRLMYLSRRIDDAQIRLKSQQETFFQIAGAGHEAALVAAGKVLRSDHDWFYPYYRDLGLALTLGVEPVDVLAQAVGSSEDPASGGRQMPHHWGSDELNIVSQASCTGTQALGAVGASEVGRYAEAVEGLDAYDLQWEDDEVVYMSIGDGATSEGEFWEALNTASNDNLPVLFMVEDNGYAISVPTFVQTAGGSISKCVRGFEDLYVTEFDGCDPVESYGELDRAVEYVREGNGPALAHAHVIRPYSHSVSDDERMYKTEEEREAEKKRDPLDNFPEFLVDEGFATEDELEELEAEVDERVEAAVDEALDLPEPDTDSVLDYKFSPDVDPTSSEFDTEPDPDPDADESTMVDHLNDCLHTEMARDPRIVVFGEDIADVSKEEYIDDVKGKGGVFKVTHGLQKRFGRERCFNSPLAEANIVGRGIGMATRGLKPVVEIQFFDYIWPAFMQMRNEMSNMRWRSNNAFSAPLVVRVPIGGYLKGGGPYHSQSGVTLYSQTPGFRIVLPSTAQDANGLLRTAIRCEDPVIFLEPKHLYRQTHNQAPNPGPDYMVPFGKARLVQEGEDLTVITYGSTVQRSVKAADQTDASVEIIDLRSLDPIDWESIALSVKKTNKALVVYEDNQSWGYGTELATRIGDELFEYLDGPVKRVASKDSFVAYHPKLEEEILPQ
ncbi:MAG: thiamine pyrophosphate-dependent enzyme, partial [Bradymonadaceae bacterium]